MEKSNPGRIIMATVLSVGIFMGWQTYMKQKYPQMMEAKEAQKLEKQAAEGSKAGAPNDQVVKKSGETQLKAKPVAKQALNRPEKFWEYNQPDWKVKVSSKGGRIASIVLSQYKDRKGNPIELADPKDSGLMLVNLKGVQEFPNFQTLDYDISSSSENSVQLTGSLGGFTVQKLMKFDPVKYVIETQIKVDGSLAGLRSVGISGAQSYVRAEATGLVDTFTFGIGQPIQEYFFNVGSTDERIIVNPDEGLTEEFKQTQFASLGTRYFTTLFYNKSDVLPTGKAFRIKDQSFLELDYPHINNSQSVTLNLDVYTGPKIIGMLNKVGPEAGTIVDFGIFSWLGVPMLKLMRWFYDLFKNWGVAIILLTIVVRTITFPFTYMSFKSMKGMQKIQPQIKRIREIHKDNPQQMNMEVMQLMRANKVNPMGGCLPMLLQFPVFIALYAVLQNSIELYQAPFVFWIHDLSQKDPYFVLPVLMGITMFLQQKLTPTAMDPAQARVMLMLPFVMTIFMLGLPSGLTLYIFVSTLFGVIQQVTMMQDRKEANTAVVRRA